MKISKSFIFDLHNDTAEKKKRYENADFSFLINIGNISQLANAYKKLINLLATKEITVDTLRNILECLEKYSKIIEKLELTTINERLDEVQKSAKQLCVDHSLPVVIKERDLEEDDELDYRYYQNALSKSKNRIIEMDVDDDD